jgi:hypothetical protein
VSETSKGSLHPRRNNESSDFTELRLSFIQLPPTLTNLQSCRISAVRSDINKSLISCYSQPVVDYQLQSVVLCIVLSLSNSNHSSVRSIYRFECHTSTVECFNLVRLKFIVQLTSFLVNASKRTGSVLYCKEFIITHSSVGDPQYHQNENGRPPLPCNNK